MCSARGAQTDPIQQWGTKQGRANVVSGTVARAQQQSKRSTRSAVVCGAGSVVWCSVRAPCAAVRAVCALCSSGDARRPDRVAKRCAHVLAEERGRVARAARV